MVGVRVFVSRFVSVIDFSHPTRVTRYVHMLKSPGLYGVGIDYQGDDGGVIQKRADIVHSAAVLLEKCHLIKCERSSGRFQGTELGRVASHYYVTHNQHLRLTMSSLELFRVFALLNEFKLLPVSDLQNSYRGIGSLTTVSQV